MKTSLRPLIGPAVMLAMGGLIALIAEATVWLDETADYYGMLKLVSDLVLLLGGGWLFVAIGAVLRTRFVKPS